MKTRIQKWGNSLALRIPRPFANEVGFQKESLVDLAIVDGKLVITPVPKTPLTLEHLVSGITQENLHAEVKTGSAAGNEIW